MSQTESMFIDPENDEILDSAIIDKYSFLLPCKAFNIEYTISKGKEFPITYEFILRYLNLNGPTNVDSLGAYFGFSSNELATELEKLINEKYIVFDSRTNVVQLSMQGKDLFIDEKPELVKIEDRKDRIAVELISFNLVKPQSSPHRHAFINLKLNNSEAERASHSNELAKEAFINGYYKYIDRGDENDHIYQQSIRKIDSITALYNFPIELRANLEMKITPGLDIELQLPKLYEFNEQRKILIAVRRQAKESIQEGNEDRTSHVNNFLNIFENEDNKFIGNYVTKDMRFMFALFIKDVFIKRIKAYPVPETQLLLGSPFLSLNFNNLLTAIKLINLTGKNEDDINPIFWIRPSYPFWGRSQESVENLNKIKNELEGNNQLLLFTDTKNAGVNGWDAKRRYRYYFDSIIEFENISEIQNIEFILSPNKFVCAMYYHSIKGILYKIPFGIISMNEKIVIDFQKYLSRKLKDKLNRVLIGKPFWGGTIADAFNIMKS